MESPAETYRLIVKHIEGKADLCALCRVNKGFQHAAEQALYNTISTVDAWDSLSMCSLFANTPRLAAMVVTLILLTGEEDDSDDDRPLEAHLPDDFWPTVSRALHQTTGLRFLGLHLEGTSDAAQAWILSDTAFQLRGFHCDLQWDIDLVSFLNTQPDIDDLYIVDYILPEDTPKASIASPLDIDALPNLSTLQCTFTEAACALVPARPVSRLKTCFSKTQLQEKREELSVLFSRLMGTTHPLRSLDIADSSYSDSFAMELLASVVELQNKVQDLRYLGMLVLPIDGDVRLKFYGLLRVIRYLECIEVDVSEWEPSPPVPAGMQALASEMRLYCPSLQRVIFVSDFERTVVAVAHGRYSIDYDCNTENIWREI